MKAVVVMVVGVVQNRLTRCLMTAGSLLLEAAETMGAATATLASLGSLAAA